MDSAALRNIAFNMEKRRLTIVRHAKTVSKGARFAARAANSWATDAHHRLVGLLRRRTILHALEKLKSAIGLNQSVAM